MRSKRLAWEPSIEQLYTGWHRRVVAVEEGHHRMADRLNRRSIGLGLPVVVLSTLVGTTAFASLQKTEHIDAWIKVAVGSVGVAAAILASAQTFLGYAKRSERHRIASIRYESLRRDMAQAIALPPSARPDAHQELDRVRTRMEKYAKESPAVPERLWRQLCGKFEIKPSPPPIQ
jgi:hypothetical protein